MKIPATTSKDPATTSKDPATTSKDPATTSKDPAIARSKGKINFLVRKLRDEEGSASVELVIFAIPLFIPLLMLASHAMSISSSKIETSHLARTALRAFVTAPSTPLGHARVQQVLKVAELGTGFTGDGGSRTNPDLAESTGLSASTQRVTYLIECRRQPCIQPSNRVRIRLKDQVTGVEVVATLHTDQWIQGEPGFRRDVSGGFFGYRDVADLDEEIAPILGAKDFIERAKETVDVISGK